MYGILWPSYRNYCGNEIFNCAFVSSHTVFQKILFVNADPSSNVSLSINLFML